MTKDNQVWDDCFSTPFERLATAFVGIQTGGRYLKGQFVVAESFLILTGCYIAICRIAFKLFRSFITAVSRIAGRIA